MNFTKSTWAAVGAALLVAACGGGGGGSAGTQNDAPGRGQLMQSPPPRITSLTAADYNAKLIATPTGQSLLTLSTGSATGTVPCGVDVQYMKYGTVGGNAEATTASAALMVPTGTDPKCTGARPIVLFAHGTTVEKRYNLADFTDTTNPAYGQAQLLASLFAAQGYIVVAPNYAGYDSSNLSYHPYLVADQQSKDMMDALAAAKTALPTLISGATASTKLFVTGYSQGGHVAMATHRALQTAGIPVTASAPMSGPYALAYFSDAIVGGRVNAGSTILLPMLVSGYQKSYGDIYATSADYYETPYATGIESLFPSAYTNTTLITSGKLPQLAAFNSTSPAPAFDSVTPLTAGGTAGQLALWKSGFGASNLFKNSMRVAYLTDVAANPDSVVAAAATPANTLRQRLKQNDLRTWSNPGAPILMCGGANDPTVYYAANTTVMATIWSAQVTAGLVSTLDLDAAAGAPGPTNPFYGAKAGFQATNTAIYTAAYNANFATTSDVAAATVAGQTAVVASYHGGAAPFCTAAARGFFSLF